MNNTYEHCIIRGIPFYKKRGGDGDNSGATGSGSGATNNRIIIYTFDQYSEPVAIGTYDATTDDLNLSPTWKQSVEQQLTQFRTRITEVDRDKLRENITKPTKSRKTTRNPRKTTRAKSTAGQ